jgi:hypothetical protein
VIIEGVGGSRRALAPLLDVAVWVQSDFDEARRLLEDRPWERAHFLVATASSLPHNPRTEVMVASPGGPALKRGGGPQPARPLAWVTCANQRALSFGVRSSVSKSTWTSPKRLE